MNMYLGCHLESMNHIGNLTLCQSMHIYVKNNPLKFQQGTIWNDGILVLFCRVSPQQEQQKQQDE